MHDNVFATKRFTRNAAQQAVKQTLYQLSDFWKQNIRCNAAKRPEKTIKQHVMPFLPPPAHATNFWRSTYCSIRPDCLLLLSYGVLTVTNPSDVLYKPVTVWPWRSRTDCGLARASFRLVVSRFRTVEECVPNVIAGNRGFCNLNPWPGPSQVIPYKHRKRHTQY